MKGKCRFILSLILVICSASGIIAFADDSDALTGTYDSEISIMTIDSPEENVEDVSKRKKRQRERLLNLR
ncbi:MAG: hypothetical protein GX625_08035 [Clostridiaceae bacterium]|nr:hypothetical protein [Clostridiaceae bacterium]